MSRTVIAIDGPAASGKSSVAQGVAQRLGFRYVNSGAFYRALTWRALESGVDVDCEDAVRQFAQQVEVTAGFDGARLALRIDGNDPEPHLRDEGVNRAVSAISRSAAIRGRLLSMLRTLAEEQPLVMEGRDIGTVVFPDTPYKFYIDASPEVREERRRAQGETDAIRERDRIDSSREAAPLAAAPDAVRIDTTHLSLDEVIWEVISRLAESGLMPHAS